MKRIFIFQVIVIAMFIGTNSLFAQNDRVWINPGLKLGYTFGENGGFTWGYELSITFQQETIIRYVKVPYCIGLVLDVDYCKNITKTHFGAEFASLGGLCVGPTWISEGGKTDLGFSIIAFTGVILYPAYTYTYRKEKQDIHEIGGYLKLPITDYYTIDVP